MIDTGNLIVAILVASIATPLLLILALWHGAHRGSQPRTRQPNHRSSRSRLDVWR